ncbi:MAG: hypothetical protein LBJ67_12065 [Planctomycetaceae bacterium]|nr:hypothetical protein [Planctomycetaceae bacterium]
MKKQITCYARYCLLFGAMLTLLFGCDKVKKPDGLPELYPLSIKLTQEKDKPLVDASVRLMTTDKNATTRWSISGSTNAQGVAALKTHGEYSGAPTGTYKIVVTKEEIVYDKSNPPQIIGRFHLVESKYANIVTTPLTIEVKPDTKSIEFDLGKVVHEKMETPP